MGSRRLVISRPSPSAKSKNSPGACLPRGGLEYRFMETCSNSPAKRSLQTELFGSEPSAEGSPARTLATRTPRGGGLEGLDGQRSGLWAEYRRLIRELRPDLVFVENVTALLGRGINRVLGDLAALGYDSEWHCVPASAVGAPHDRDRVWIVAYPMRIGLEGRTAAGDNHAPGQPILSWGALARALGESHANGGRWAHEPALDRVVDGVPDRVAAIKSLGNAVVPVIPEVLGRVFGPLVKAAA